MQRETSGPSSFATADYEAIQRALARAFRAGSEVLELGCGSCREASWLCQQHVNLVALDTSHPLLLRGRRLHPEMAGRQCRLRLPHALPFRDDCFDGVFAVALLMHLDHQAIVETISEVARVLRSGGAFYVAVSARREETGADERDDRGRSIRCYGRDDWLELFSQSGFFEAAPSDDVPSTSSLEWHEFLLKGQKT